MDKTTLGAFAFLGLMYGLLLAAAIGWGMNIWKLATMGTDAIGLLILRIVGIFIAPIGAIIGWM